MNTSTQKEELADLVDDSEGKELDYDNLRPNVSYLVWYTIVCCLGSSQIGISIAVNGQAAQELNPQLDVAASFTGILAGSNFLGITIGAVIGGKMMASGRRRTILVANFIGIVGGILSVILIKDVVLLGRFLFGICSGMNLAACPTLIEETIPSSLMDKGFGTSTAIGINLLIMSYLFSGLAMPTDPVGLGQGQLWRVLFLFPIIFQVILILASVLKFKYDSLNFMVNHDNKDEAIELLKAIYPNEKDHIHGEIYKDMRIKAGKSENSAQAEEVETSLFTALTDVDYREASWIVIYIFVAFNTAGIAVLNTLPAVIFADIAKNGGSSSITPNQQTVFIGISNFLGALLSNLTVRNFTRRAVFLVGVSFVGIFMILLAISVAKAQSILALLFACLAIIAFQMSLGSACFLYASEVMVDAGIGACYFTQFGLTTIQVFTILNIVTAVGIANIFYVFAGLNFLSVFILYFGLRETKGLDANQKKNLYRKNKIKFNQKAGEEISSGKVNETLDLSSSMEHNPNY